MAKTVATVVRAQLRDAVMGRLSPTSPLTRRLAKLSRVPVLGGDGLYHFVGTIHEVGELLACAHRWSPADVPALSAVVTGARMSGSAERVLVDASATPARTAPPVDALRRFASAIA